MLESLSIVVPAYNEAPTIEAVVREALSVGATVAVTVEVLVCDDGSTDGTYEILQGLARSHPNVRVLHRSANRGIEASLRALFAEARFKYVFFTSADRQWPMTSLSPMAQVIEAGADIVVGERRNRAEVYSPYRRIVSSVYQFSVQRLGVPVRDPGSIKLGRTECFRLPVVSRGVFSDGERLVRAARARYRLADCPVEFHPRRSGTALGARPGLVAQAALDLLRTSASLVFGRPRPTPSEPEPGLERVGGAG
ncbi:MAG TPA: glycosyltransferase family 2 protein [Vicinamibacterales bacterium]|nr:glycosyltransferase family 2 protein [Vicinamibacterales bacterium]